MSYVSRPVWGDYRAPTHDAPQPQRATTGHSTTTSQGRDGLAAYAERNGGTNPLSRMTQTWTGYQSRGNGNGNYASNWGGKGNGDAGKGDVPEGKGNTPPPPPPIKAEHGRIWGDPHFVGAEGGKYDVQGEDGKVYSLLSDKGVQVNGLFKAGRNEGTTLVNKLGITLGSDQIEIGVNGALKINGEAKTEDGVYLDGAINKRGGDIAIKTAEYDIDVQSKKGNINLDLRSHNVVADGVKPHGLWGQTADGDGEKRNGDKGRGAQGGGAIENADGEITERGDKTAVETYEVGGLFDVEFDTFNRFA